MRRIVFLIVIFCSLPLSALAQEAKPMSDDPELDKRLMALSEQLRCLVCQNETLAGSHADLAVDLRKQIREQMKAGKSDKEIVAFLTERYGDFVLYNPPVNRRTYLLWFGPFILLGGGLVAFYSYIKRRRGLITDQPLSAEERKRAGELLKAQPGQEPS
jgi:cytochrome c-type biogenesis protein CcmH